MIFNFTPVVKKTKGALGLRLDPNIIRVTQKTIQLGENLAIRFSGSVESTPSGKGKRCFIRFEVDEANSAFYIAPDPTRGFSFTVTPNGMHTVMSKTLRKVLTVGDYVEVQHNIFKLA